ncbi:MAG: hypothetical protein M3121_05625 [Chloroflexota bacterium]|nr:hypothetical protein [Chloroflexota bacterium]
MAQRSGGNFREVGSNLVEKARAWLGQKLQGVLHGPEVGPSRAQGGGGQAVEPEPTEAAREERGRRDAGVAQDAQQLDERATSLTGQPTIDTVESGTAVVTESEEQQPTQRAQPGPSPETGVSGHQHQLVTESAAHLDARGAASTDAEPSAANDPASTTPPNQHDLDNVEPPLDTTRAGDAQTDVAGTQSATGPGEAARLRDTSVTTDPGRPPGVTGASGLPEEATAIPAGEPATEEDVQADAEVGSTWAPVHGDTSYDEMTREPVENVGGQVASVVPDVGGVTGTAGATNLDDSAGAPAELVGLDDSEAQIGDLRDRPPSETDFPDEFANDAPAEDDRNMWSGSEGEAADLQFGSLNEELGFGTFDSRPEETEEAGVLGIDPDEGSTPEEYGVASGATAIVPDSDDEALVGDLERDIDPDETGGGTNIAAAAAVIDADASQDTPRGAVRGDGSEHCPPGYPVKGNANSKIYHLPEMSSYAATKAEFCFATEDDAVGAGYRAPRRG